MAVTPTVATPQAPELVGRHLARLLGEALAALDRKVREDVLARQIASGGPRLPALPLPPPTPRPALRPTECTDSCLKKDYPTPWPHGQVDGPSAWTGTAEEDRADRLYAVDRVRARVFVDFFDHWADGTLQLLGRRPNGVEEEVPRHLRNSAFMMLYLDTNRFVPVPYRGQVPTADMLPYSDLVVIVSSAAVDEVVATKLESPASAAAGSLASDPVDQIRQTSIAQSGESQYPAIGDLPEHRHLTACEVLTWIGYRRVIPKDVYYAPFTKEPGLPVEEGVSLLHRSVPEPKPSEDPMDEAERKLMEALRASHVHLLIERNGAFEELPDTIYEHAIAVNARGSIEVDAKATERDRARAGSYLSRLRPIGDVWFRKIEVLEAWPNTVGDGERPHPRPPEVSEATATSLNETLLANPTSNAPVGEPMLEQVGEQANPASSAGGAEVVAPAEITGAGEVTAPAPTTPSDALRQYLARPDVPRSQKDRFKHYRELNDERVAGGEKPWPYLSRPTFTTGRKRGNPGHQ